WPVSCCWPMTTRASSPCWSASRSPAIWPTGSSTPPRSFGRYSAGGRRRTVCSGVPVSTSHAGHDVFGPGVVVERVDGQVTTIAGALEPAPRDLAREHQVGVDPHGAEVELRGDVVAAPGVCGPDRGGQPEGGVVGAGQRLVLVGEGLDGDDRPEDLLAGTLRTVGHVNQHR